jgi:serine/threonine protein kinase
VVTSAPRPGSRLGRYEIVRLLAVGGMAEIYLARVAGLAGFEKQVVVKRILPHLVLDPTYVEMFLNEARLAATLDHPNIAHVYDVGEDSGSYYYAMEYVRGADLRRLLQATSATRSPIPLDCIAAIGLGMCAGLDFAHSHTDEEGRSLGIIHRDVTPSNVLVSYDGAVKISDFGVAKVLAAEATKSGIKGKIGYMSPEQCQADSLDRRSDIFSIGIVLYELATGARLFAADSEFAAMEAIVRGTIVRPSQRRPDLSPAFEAILMRALERHREARYPTARDMHRDLEALVRAEGLAATPTALAELVNRIVPQSSRSSQRIDTAHGLSASPTQVLGSKPPIRAASEAVTGELEPPSVSIQPVSVVSPATPSRRRWPWLVVAALGAAGVTVVAWKPWQTRPGVAATAAHDAGVIATVVADATIANTPEPADAAVQLVDATEAVAVVPPDAAEPAPTPRAKNHRHGGAGGKKTARTDTPAPRVSIDAGVPPIADAAKVVAVISPPPPPPPPSKGSLEATAALSIDVRGLPDSEIQRGLDRANAVKAFQSCYHTAAAAAGKTVATEVRVTFEVDESRAARKASASGGAMPGLASCVGQVIGQVRTNNPPDIGNAHVTLNVSFHPVP